MPIVRPARRRLRALAGGLGVEDEVTTENKTSNTDAEEAQDGD
jgi:hypothetical protein